MILELRSCLGTLAILIPCGLFGHSIDVAATEPSACKVSAAKLSAGEFCQTDAKITFTRVENGFRDEATRVIWYDQVIHKTTQMSANQFCQRKGLELPTGYARGFNGKSLSGGASFSNSDSDFVLGLRHGIREVLPGMRHTFRSASLRPDNRSVFILYGAWDSYKNHGLSARCIQRPGNTPTNPIVNDDDLGEIEIKVLGPCQSTAPQLRVGEACISQAGVKFIRRTNGFEDTKSNVTWDDTIQHRVAPPDSERICVSRGLVLPTGDAREGLGDFAVGLRNGLAEVLKGLEHSYVVTNDRGEKALLRGSYLDFKVNQSSVRCISRGLVESEIFRMEEINLDETPAHFLVAGKVFELLQKRIQERIQSGSNRGSMLTDDECLALAHFLIAEATRRFIAFEHQVQFVADKVARMEWESGFSPRLVNSIGASGLTQVMPGTAQLIINSPFGGAVAEYSRSRGFNSIHDCLVDAQCSTRVSVAVDDWDRSTMANMGFRNADNPGLLHAAYVCGPNCGNGILREPANYKLDDPNFFNSLQSLTHPDVYGYVFGITVKAAQNQIFLGTKSAAPVHLLKDTGNRAQDRRYLFVGR